MSDKPPKDGRGNPFENKTGGGGRGGPGRNDKGGAAQGKGPDGHPPTPRSPKGK